MDMGRVTGATGRRWLVAVAVAAAGLGVGASGAQAQYGPPQTVLSGFAPGGVAVDGAGDVANSTPGANRVDVDSASGWDEIISHLSRPEGVAYDGEGNLFIADSGDNRVVEALSSGLQQIGSGFDDPQGVAVDGAGDVFVADTGDNRVVEVLRNGSQQAVGSGFSAPQSVAADGQGDVFVADTGDNRVVEVAPDGTQQVIGSGFSAPQSVAVDGHGDVFVGTTDEVVEVFAGGGQQVLASGVDAVGLALDPSGDLYVADAENEQVTELAFSADATSVALSCGPAAAVGVTQRCSVSVTDTSTPSLDPTGTVALSASGQGSFGDNTASCTLVGGECYLDYTPSAVGSGEQTITADYEGAYQYTAAIQTSGLTINALTPRVNAKCATPTATQLTQVAHGKAVTIVCTATVRPPAGVTHPPVPTGTVSFSASPGADRGEEIEPGTCTLKPVYGGASCTTHFVTAAPDVYTITGSYGGDGHYVTGSGSATFNLG